MANYIENLGLEPFTETEQTTANLINKIVTEGEHIIGYDNLLFANYHFGSAQFIAPIKLNEESKSLEVKGLDTHAAGRYVWKARVNEINLDTNKDYSKRIAISDINNEGFAVVNVVNHDVLPSYLPNEVIELQMIGFPFLINYYDNMDEYSDDDMFKSDTGKVFCLAEGCVAAIGLLNRSEDEENEDSTGLTAVCGIVKNVYMGKVQLGDKEIHPFVRCVVDTNFGELELLHTIDMVEPEMQSNMKKGAVVYMAGELQGDVAIDNYEKGFVKDFDNNLKALAYSLGKGNANRLKPIMSDAVQYYSEESEKELNGKDEVVEWLNYVIGVRKNPPRVYYATVTESSDGLEYTPGTRCLLLSYADQGFDNIVFMDTDDENNISRILISCDTGYKFKADDIPKPDYPDIVPNKSITEAMIARANLTILNGDINEEDVKTIISKNIEKFQQRIFDLSSENCLDNTADFEKTLKTILGYFFAMSVLFKETEWKFNNEDCFADRLPKMLSVVEIKTYSTAYKNGELFYNDFKLWLEKNDCNEKGRTAILFEGLMTLQAIAHKYKTGD